MKPRMSIPQFMLLTGLLTPVAAQDPPTREPAPRDVPAADTDAPAAPTALTVELYTLGALLEERVYHLVPLGDAAATEASTGRADTASTRAESVARIRDAVFDAEGALQALLVQRVPEPDDPLQRPLLVLPAKEVRWDARRRMLVSDLDRVQVAGLPAEQPAAAAEGSSPPPDRSFRASELRDARPQYSDPSSRPMVDMDPTLWFAPATGRLLFVSLPIDQQPRLLPWSIVSPQGHGDACTLRLAADAATVATAPRLPEATTPPESSLREVCYRHFGQPVPQWDRNPAAAPRPGDGKRP